MEEGPGYHRKTPHPDYPDGKPSALALKEADGFDVGRVSVDFAGQRAWEGFHRLSSGRSSMGGMGGGTSGIPWPWVRSWIEVNVPRDEWAFHDKWIAALDDVFTSWLSKKLEKAQKASKAKSR